MKRSLAAVVALLTVTVGACDPNGKKAGAPVGEAPSASSASTTAADAMSPKTSMPAPPADAAPSGDVLKVGGAPDFAAIYPGGNIEAPPTVAGGPAGPGGIVSFTTDAKPDAVIGFYKQRAEAAGLASVMSMNQGDSQAYGAAEVTNGATLQVVATALEDAPTTVQLTWSAGQ